MYEALRGHCSFLEVKQCLTLQAKDTLLPVLNPMPPFDQLTFLLWWGPQRCWQLVHLRDGEYSDEQIKGRFN